MTTLDKSGQCMTIWAIRDELQINAPHEDLRLSTSDLYTARPQGIAWNRHALLWPLLAMVVLWTVVPALVHSAPPLDVVESAMWGREWVVGTYKHPAMPAWFVEAGRYLNGGRIGWPAYFASQLFNLATLLCTYLLARDLINERVATAAVLSLLGVEYFSWRSIEFNHTIAQMPFWVGAALCAWRAVDRGALVWWLALGLVAALGLYAKLSNAMLLIVIAGWILATPKGRATLKTAWPWLGAAVFAVMCAPLLHWLVTSDFQSLAYASARGRDQSVLATLLFPANAALQAAPIALALALAGLFSARTPDVAIAARTPAAMTFLLWIAVLPPLLSIVSALLGGSGLRASWLAPSLPLLGVLFIARFEHKLTQPVQAYLGRVGLALTIALPLVYAVAVPNLHRWTTAQPLRVVWPQADIARELAAAWSAETSRPLRIVAGTSWIAGLVGIDHPDRPSIMTEGVAAFSPWIKPERLRHEGALLVWTEGRGANASPDLVAMAAGHEIRERRIAFAHGKNGEDIVVKYVVLQPSP